MAPAGNSKGLGMNSWRRLVKVELPLAMPVIMAGIRTSMVLIIGTTTIAALIGAGGLGDLITVGISRNDTIPCQTADGLELLLIDTAVCIQVLTDMELHDPTDDKIASPCSDDLLQHAFHPYFRFFYTRYPHHRRFLARDAATASMVITPKYRPMNMTIPVEMFQNGVASPRPSNPDPLLAADDVNSYMTCVSPWNP